MAAEPLWATRWSSSSTTAAARRSSCAWSTARAPRRSTLRAGAAPADAAGGESRNAGIPARQRRLRQRSRRRCHALQSHRAARARPRAPATSKIRRYSPACRSIRPMSGMCAIVLARLRTGSARRRGSGAAAGSHRRCRRRPRTGLCQLQCRRRRRRAAHRLRSDRLARSIAPACSHSIAAIISIFVHSSAVARAGCRAEHAAGCRALLQGAPRTAGRRSARRVAHGR